MRPTPVLFVFLAAATAARAQYTALNSSTPATDGRFGWSVSSVPDVNADGKPDIVVGAMGEAIPSNAHAGRVHVYSGATGASLLTITPPTPQPIGTFGWAVAGMPDVTGDGRGDIIVGGMWETDPSNVVCGRAYLFSGATGALVRAWLSPNRVANGGFGWSVAWVPDVNGDGRPDIIIGAPGERIGSGPAGAGRAYVFSGATGGLLRTLSSPNPEQSGDFGSAVVGMSDIDGDGRGDIAVGAPFEDPGASAADCGRVYIFSGATGALIRAMGSPYSQAGGNFGTSIAVLSDLNGDGKPDLAIGAPGEHDGTGSGWVHVFSGATGAGLRHLHSPFPVHHFGVCVSRVPDMNGDGRDEIVVGTDGETTAAGARATIFSGATGAVLRTITSPGTGVNSSFGSAVCGIGDTNGDGRGDVVIGAWHDASLPAPANQGRVYLFR